MLDDGLKARLFPYMGGILRELEVVPILINGPADHVHLLADIPARTALSDVMRVLKTNSSHWIHEQFPGQWSFGWQTGYGAFSVSRSHTEAVREYIAGQ